MHDQRPSVHGVMGQDMSRRFDNARARAKRLFVHYMTFTWREVGIRVDGDNVAEWEEIVDSIVDAAVAKALQEIKEQGNE